MTFQGFDPQAIKSAIANLISAIVAAVQGRHKAAIEDIEAAERLLASAKRSIIEAQTRRP